MITKENLLDIQGYIEQYAGSGDQDKRALVIIHDLTSLLLSGGEKGMSISTHGCSRYIKNNDVEVDRLKNIITKLMERIEKIDDINDDIVSKADAVEDIIRDTKEDYKNGEL